MTQITGIGYTQIEKSVVYNTKVCWSKVVILNHVNGNINVAVASLVIGLHIYAPHIKCTAALTINSQRHFGRTAACREYWKDTSQ